MPGLQALTDPKSRPYILAAGRIADRVKALKEYGELAKEEKKHASKEEIEHVTKLAAESPDAHGN